MAGHITFITGGARSGKSRYAQQTACALSSNPLYVATARIADEDFEARVQRHRGDRPPEVWTSLEEDKFPSRLDLSGRTVVLDCTTLWLTNFCSDHQWQCEQAFEAWRTEADCLLSRPFHHLLIISNELGMGLHADTEIGRKFTDVAGWANQHLAARAHTAIMMVSGLPLYLKKTDP
ncbi:bifunctional adenosylcobinamide kinase/adenosylcobinamide-phosphate guanylyltransferase [Roseivirga sp. BDSF3-8]|uniref:bifunctional adenosylcobinamide kinase/adenosylcobinamide-phosphate guanylyltransferase n=1 Tax=Roseivirga sp. BDSF3-8 TaxID=3241598 RepID=UPI003531BC55